MTEARAVLAGRVVLKRDLGKLVFATIRDRDAELQVVFDRGRLDAGRVRVAARAGPRRHHRRGGHGGHDAARRAQPVRRALGDAHEGAPAPAREVARAAGPGPAAAPPVPPPDHRRGAAASGARARRGPAHDPLGARGARLRRVRGADPADGRRRRERASLHHVPPRARHPDEAPDLARALPEADARGGLRPRVRAGPQLPERGHRPRPQSGVHDARGLRGLRRLRRR